MLVLGRRSGQRVVCELADGRQLVVTLVAGGDGRARLGFEAPADVRIYREELGTRRIAPAA